MTGGMLRPEGSTRAWRRLRLWVLNRDGWRCQAPGAIPAASGSWAALYAPGSWNRRTDDNGAGVALVCGDYADHADHVTPRALGGSDDPANVRASCARHNLARGSRLDTSTTSTDDNSGRPSRWEW